ncbi:MAG: murein biosynthesis integral membrane protein MurJ [Acidimicrobiia bacterium]|nr:MAG: murein biosynthesis integral membrane protein MurJ [Acidimicrobiia bacterium]
MTALLARLRRGDMGTAAMVVAAGILVSRLLGILRDVIFAAMLGSDGTTDVYVAAFRIPDFANYLLAGGFLTITFIPIFSAYIAADDEEEGWKAFSAILRWLVLGTSVAIVLAWLAAPSIIALLYPDFSPEQVSSTTTLTRIVLPAQFAFVVGSMFAAVQYAKGVFTIPTLAPIAYNLGIISGGVIYALVTGTPDPAGFIWGALVGAFAGNFVLQVWGARRVGMRLHRRVSWRHPAILSYIAIALPLMIGQSIVALDEIFMSVFGEMAGTGSQTNLQYARRTMFVPIGVIAQAAAVAAYPTLSRLFAEGNRPELLRTVNKALRYVLVLSIGAAGFVAAMTVPTTRVLFERGAFTADDTVAVAAALFMYAFGIPIWGALQIITRAFYAKREMWTPVIIGTAITFGAIPTYAVMVNLIGFQGVAITSVLTLGIYTGVLFAVWYRPRDARAGFTAVAASAGRAIPLAVPAALAASAVSWLISTGLSGSTQISAIVALALGAVTYVAVIIAIGGVLHDLLWSRQASATDADDTTEIEHVAM